MKNLIALRSSLLVCFLSCLGVVGWTTNSQAISIDETIIKNDTDLGGGGDVPLADQIISFTGLNPNPTSDATITFAVRGDFNNPNENVILSVDEGAYSFGTWLNNNDTDDTIVGPAGDGGSPYVQILTGTAVISLATFSGLIADGNLNFLFDYAPMVTDSSQSRALDLASVRVRYDAVVQSNSVVQSDGSIQQMPEPSTMLLFGSGLAGLGFWRYRQNQKP